MTPVPGRGQTKQDSQSGDKLKSFLWPCLKWLGGSADTVGGLCCLVTPVHLLSTNALLCLHTAQCCPGSSRLDNTDLAVFSSRPASRPTRKQPVESAQDIVPTC
ncbi:hypothetical protein AAFF_G00115950 [Aldrovandia affinis]|uniref:Uncharacterized protein n=1 Tax=Aldrovandia affinis TaxID=143900 RepID=A0AAD7T1F4_9TELE|nr:hypothetical protein AAFF_G00115950 [Aldrovandia affinis]